MDIKERVDLKGSVELMKVLKKHEYTTLKDISEKLSLSESTVKRMIKKLQNIGVMIENKGSRRKPDYHVTNWGIINEEYLVTDSSCETIETKDTLSEV